MRILVLTSLAVLVVGLNLMVIWRTLTATAARPPQPVPELKKMGVGVLVAGIVILLGVLGMRWKLGLGTQDMTALLSMGATVVALGITSTIIACGTANEKVVGRSALVIIGIGIGLFFAWLIAAWLLKCNC